MAGTPFGKYLRGARLATGGMGEVYVAVQQGLGKFEKPLALKLLLPHLAEDPAAVQMFLVEAQLAARMSHPNVVQIYDVGLAHERYYIALELVRGVSLAVLLSSLRQAGQRLTPAQLTLVARALCDALHHAHELTDGGGVPLDIVHRDVSPQNILVSVDGEVKLTDFGIAKARDITAGTRPGLVKGKFEYLAPEQSAGGAVDRRADLFAAGVTLHHAATGISPFRRDHDAATLRATERDELPPLPVLRPDLPPALVEAVHRAANKDPERRFPTARAMRALLPPAPPPEVAESLGALVQALCAEGLARLDTRCLQEEVVTTPGEVPSAPGEDPTRSERKSGRPRQSRLLVGSAVAVGLLLAAAGLFIGARAATQPPDVGGSPKALAQELAPPPPEASPEVEERPPAALPAPADADEPEPATPVESPRPAKVAQQGRARAQPPGYLTVDAVPWAHVYLGARRLGETPLHQFPLEPGWVTLTLRNPETGRQAQRRVRIVSGKRAYTRVNLE